MPNRTLPASSGPIVGTSPTTNSTPVWLIVGVVLGGMAIILLLIGCFLWSRKKKPQDGSRELNKFTTFLLLPVLSSGQEILGTVRGAAASSGAPTSSPLSSASISSLVSITLLQTGPPGLVHKSPGSVGGETVLTWPVNTDISTSGAGPLTAEFMMKEAHQLSFSSPPAYET